MKSLLILRIVTKPTLLVIRRIVCCLALIVSSWQVLAIDASGQDLPYHLPSPLVTVIKLPQENRSVEVPIVRFPSELPITKGVILLISDLDAQGSAQHSLYMLAKRLPSWGWDTLYIVPKEDFFVGQEEADEETNAETKNDVVSNEATNDMPEPDAVDENQAQHAIKAMQTNLPAIALQPPNLNYAFDDYATFSEVLWQSIAQKFMQKPGYNILLAQGKSASVAFSLLTKELANKEQKAFNALIVSNVYWPDSHINSNLPMLLSKIDIPVLDLTSVSDSHWAMQTNTQRLVSSRVQLKPLYRQRAIIGMPLNTLQTEYFAKEVIGWATYLGW